jgi:acyl-CoA synthetase (AMP-forming)/AMP-acid ligase II
MFTLSAGHCDSIPAEPRLLVTADCLTFRELHSRVEGIAATLTSRGFGVGDRLALLLPNGPDYIELVYACSMLGVIAVPLNTRLSTKEIDRVLEDAHPRGIVRHSSLAVPGVQLSWQQVIDQESSSNSATLLRKSFTTRSRFGPYLHERHDGAAKRRHGDAWECPC